ncbi:hypothetical protein STENM327S_03497 [Streptomyces tendae]
MSRYTIDLSGEAILASHTHRGVPGGRRHAPGVGVTSPRWYSQPYPPEGASAAEGIRKQLGSPKLHPPTVLVRSRPKTVGTHVSPCRPLPSTTESTFGPLVRAHMSTWRDALLAGAPAGTDNFPLRGDYQEWFGSRTRRLRPRNKGPWRSDPGGQGRRAGEGFRFVHPQYRGASGQGTGRRYLRIRQGHLRSAVQAGAIRPRRTRCRTPKGGFETRLIGCGFSRESYVAVEGNGDRRFTGGTGGATRQVTS